jgi:hypothetical protein
MSESSCSLGETTPSSGASMRYIESTAPVESFGPDASKIKCPGNCEYASLYSYSKKLVSVDSCWAYCCFRCWQLHGRQVKGLKRSQGTTIHGDICKHVLFDPAIHGNRDEFDEIVSDEEHSDLVSDEEMIDGQTHSGSF